MTALASGVILVVAFGLAAAAGLAVAVALFRVSGRPQTGGPDGEPAADREQPG